MERLKPLIIVADDAAQHPAIDRGIRRAAENEALTHFDVMIEEPRAREIAMSLKGDYPELAIGLHVDIGGDMSDRFQSGVYYFCRWMPVRHFREKVLRATEYQFKKFQDMFGCQPAHLSTHGHVHMDHSDNPFPWFVEFAHQGLIEGDCGVVIRGIQTRLVRHIRAREARVGRNPLTPEDFGRVLTGISAATDKTVELAVHPATDGYEDEPELNAIYSLPLREKDLDGLIRIINSGVVEDAGYEICYSGYTL